MCGVVGIFSTELSSDAAAAWAPRLRPMADALRHRGPDGEGFERSGPLVLGHRRLSIVDLEGGRQPLSNEDGSVWLSCNGEIFNHRPLRAALEASGHRFRTSVDVEVLLHLYEERGDAFLEGLNGQFAFALYDTRRRRLILARDAFGILPMFYAEAKGALVFASEIKGVLASGLIEPRFNPVALSQMTCFGAPVDPHTFFLGIHSVMPGEWVECEDGRLKTRRHAPAPLAQPRIGHDSSEARELALEAALVESVKLRLSSADVPVGTYLSGGLDSSVISAMASHHWKEAVRGNQHTEHADLKAFTLQVGGPGYDEADFASTMAQHARIPLERVPIANRTVAQRLPEAIWHAESALFSLEPVAMLCLSDATRAQRKVVLSGQGADELLGGYPYFRLDRVRASIARAPDGWLGRLAGAAERAWTGDQLLFPDAVTRQRFERHAGGYSAIGMMFSFLSTLRPMLHGDVRGALAPEHDPLSALGAFAGALAGLSSFDRASAIAVRTTLATHLLSLQGDRMAMAHGVEVRFPFLDPQVVEACRAMPSTEKLHRGEEKAPLKRVAERWVPHAIWSRRKMPLTLPWGSALADRRAPEWAHELLSARIVADKGYFEPTVVSAALERVRQATASSPAGYTSAAWKPGFQASVRAGMALNIVATTHLWDEIFLRGRSATLFT